MAALVRLVALLLSLVLIGGPIVLALFVASVEPSWSIRASWIAPFALGGFASAAGYLWVMFVPHRVAAGGRALRWLVGCLMALPCMVAAYLLAVTRAPEMVALCSTLLVATSWLLSACIWPAWLARSDPAASTSVE
ncbi:MAG: hypothetical protein QFE16_05640 [Pseudomonadota bacterium]|nr:hypothetical protein [Pseudomonadota bacterium]